MYKIYIIYTSRKWKVQAVISLMHLAHHKLFIAPQFPVFDEYKQKKLEN